jgi:hypothetical protein
LLSNGRFVETLYGLLELVDLVEKFAILLFSRLEPFLLVVRGETSGASGGCILIFVHDFTMDGKGFFSHNSLAKQNKKRKTGEYGAKRSLLSFLTAVVLLLLFLHLLLDAYTIKHTQVELCCWLLVLFFRSGGL